jgi:hypothetical protein
MLFILILISSIFSFSFFSYTQTIYGKEMIMERAIEESVNSWFDVYCINNRWFILDWSKGEILILSNNNSKLIRKFADVYVIKGSGRWENGEGILIGYRDPVFENVHAVLYDITKDSVIEVTDKIPVGETFTNIIDVILPESWNWVATIINSSKGYLYYNNFNSFKKVATFQWADGRVFLFNDTILIGFGVSPPFYNNYYTIDGGYYILGDSSYKITSFMEEPVSDDMEIGGDIFNNKILVAGNGDLYIFEIPSFTLVSKQKLINGNFMGADIMMLNENSGYIAFSSFNSTKIYKFVYSSDRIVLIDSLILDGGWIKFAKFDGNIYLIVFQNPYHYGWSLLRIYKIKDRVTNVKEPQIPQKFMLYQNYPNPFNPSTTISYDLPIRAHVRLTIYNILGQEVATLVNNEQEPGRYNVKFDASGLPSGIYFYTLQTPYFTKTNKMVLVK